MGCKHSWRSSKWCRDYISLEGYFLAFLSLLGAKEFERVLYVLEIVAARRIASSDRHIPRQLEDVIPAHRTNAQK